jgi:FixJ family two-component response regulator
MVEKKNASAEDEPAVHIVDDDAGLREAIDGLFRSVGYRTYSFGSAADFLSSGRSRSAGCLVLDVRLPGLSGLDLQDQLAAADVTMPVILMTGHGDIPMSVRGMKAGAIDFLPKPFREQDMLDAVASALAKDAATRQERRHDEDLRGRADSLTTREREVLSRVAKGLMNKQIAFELNLSEITVKIHRGTGMKKLGARNLAEFVTMSQDIQFDV